MAKLERFAKCHFGYRANKFENYVFIVSEFAEGGSLEKWLKAHNGKANSHEEAVAITRQILQGLEGMHGEGFVHRDLKPANVLLKRGAFYLADFGISRQMKTHSKTNSTAGTYEFMPPEAFEKSPSVTPQTDIWAVGAILQVLLTGQLPFPQDEIPSLITAILYNEPEPLPESLPFALREIVKKSLQKKREDRFQSATEMREVLRNALNSPQKFVEKQTIPQAEILVLEDLGKMVKLEFPPIQEVTPIIEDNERETELRSVQTEIKTAVRQQIREASERIGEDTDKTEELKVEPTKDWREIEAERLAEERRRREEAERNSQAELEQKRREAEIEQQKDLERYISSISGTIGFGEIERQKELERQRLQAEEAKRQEEIKRRNQEEVNSQEAERKRLEIEAINKWQTPKRTAIVIGIGAIAMTILERADGKIMPIYIGIGKGALVVMILGGLIWIFAHKHDDQ